MQIRKAEAKDTRAVLRLLSQVLSVHAEIRPDLFIPGTTKYTEEELNAIFADPATPVYVAVDSEDRVYGYAFCVIREPEESNNRIAFRSIYIDDLCVDEQSRGEHVGEALYRHVLREAERLGCYEVALNVWEGNDRAKRFYEKMGMRVQRTTMEYVLPAADDTDGENEP